MAAILSFCQPTAVSSTSKLARRASAPRPSTVILPTPAAKGRHIGSAPKPIPHVSQQRTQAPTSSPRKKPPQFSYRVKNELILDSEAPPSLRMETSFSIVRIPLVRLFRFHDGRQVEGAARAPDFTDESRAQILFSAGIRLRAENFTISRAAQALGA